jgi:hypothetical protein
LVAGLSPFFADNGRTIIGCPFVAFIVVSGNAMMGSQPDFDLLSRTMNSLHGVHSRSPGVTRVVKACQQFYQMASMRYYAHMQITQKQQITAYTQVSMAQVAPSTVTDTLPSADVGDMDFSISGEEWVDMLTGWEFGAGAEDARQMTSYFESYQPPPPQHTRANLEK